MHRVTSEILTERKEPCEDLGNDHAVSKFYFKFPSHMIRPVTSNGILKYDADGDLDVERNKEGILSIEHKTSTELQLVGLQVWRGALLLADYILANPDLFKQKIILELGSGVGLTSIAASFVAEKVICTDIDKGGILKLIERNFARNKPYVKSKFAIEELDFLNLKWSNNLETTLNGVNIILAADVIYDDKITDGFVCTLEKLLSSNRQRIAYVALEKRYVFTIADLDTVAPMYEEFLRIVKRRNLNWSIEYVKIDFPRYFEYDRVKELILMKIQNGK